MLGGVLAVVLRQGEARMETSTHERIAKSDAMGAMRTVLGEYSQGTRTVLGEYSQGEGIAKSDARR